MRATAAKLLVLILCAAPAQAKLRPPANTVFPPGWVPPAGWHVDRSVKRAVTDGDLTGTGSPVRAVLLTNGVAVRLMIFVNYRSPAAKAYNAFEEPEADLKSKDGISILHMNEIEIEPGPGLCGSKWIRCDKGGAFFDSPNPTLRLQMGDWGGSVFRWNSLALGFDRLSVGD